MMSVERQILNRLLDKYEKSKSFIGTNLVNQTFTQKIDQLFPKYTDDSEYDLFCSVNNGLAALEARDFISVKRLKNDVVQSASLNTEQLEGIYKYLGRTPKSCIVGDLRSLLLKYKNANEILCAYCERQLARIKANKQVEFFDDDINAFESLLKIISNILDVKSEMFERDFSVQVLGDSKAFEKIKSKVVSLLYEYGEFPEKETLLADLNIVKNPGHVYFKGNGRISICGQILDFSKINGDIAISSGALKSIDTIDVLGKTVVTIENLTTFNAFCCDDSFAIYLGGYHNTNRRNFICKVYEQNPDKQYLHYGDIDAGGFYILQHLRNKTNIPFEPYCMDEKTLKNNIKYTKKLTENDRKRLSALLDTEFKDAISFMLDNNCKLEQEALDLLETGI